MTNSVDSWFRDYGTSEGARKRAQGGGPNTAALEKAAAERKRLNETKYKNTNTKPMRNTSQYFFSGPRRTGDLSTEEHTAAAAEHQRIASLFPEGSPAHKAHMSAAHCHSMACKSPTWASAADCMSTRARTMGGDQAAPGAPKAPSSPAPKPMPQPTQPAPQAGGGGGGVPSPTGAVNAMTNTVNKVAGLGAAVSKDSRTYDFLPGG